MTVLNWCQQFAHKVSLKCKDLMYVELLCPWKKMLWNILNVNDSKVFELWPFFFLWGPHQNNGELSCNGNIWAYISWHFCCCCLMSIWLKHVYMKEHTNISHSSSLGLRPLIIPKLFICQRIFFSITIC